MSCIIYWECGKKLEYLQRTHLCTRKVHIERPQAEIRSHGKMAAQQQCYQLHHHAAVNMDMSYPSYSPDFMHTNKKIRKNWYTLMLLVQYLFWNTFLILSQMFQCAIHLNSLRQINLKLHVTGCTEPQPTFCRLSFSPIEGAAFLYTLSVKTDMYVRHVRETSSIAPTVLKVLSVFTWRRCVKTDFGIGNMHVKIFLVLM